MRKLAAPLDTVSIAKRKRRRLNKKDLLRLEKRRLVEIGLKKGRK